MQKDSLKRKEDKFESRYPITKEVYYNNKKMFESNYNMCRDENELEKNKKFKKYIFK